MKKVDFDFIIKHLEEEIAKLEEFISGQCGTLEALVRILIDDKKHYLEWIRSAIRNERDKRQTDEDMIDASRYMMFSKKPLLTKEFRDKVIEIRKNREEATKKEILAKGDKLKVDCQLARNDIEDIRLHLKSERHTTATEKLMSVTRDNRLLRAVEVFQHIGEWIQEVRSI